MFKRRILAVTAVAMLALGILGGAVFAHERGGDGERGGAFITRVAEILGLDETTVKDAVEQAREELHDERLQSRLDAAVLSLNVRAHSRLLGKDSVKFSPAIRMFTHIVGAGASQPIYTSPWVPVVTQLGDSQPPRLAGDLAGSKQQEAGPGVTPGPVSVPPVRWLC